MLKLNSDVFSDTFKQETRIFIGVGKEGLGPTKKPHVMEDEAKALSEKLKTNKNLKVYFDYLPDENHATISELAVYNAFKVLYKALDSAK